MSALNKKNLLLLLASALKIALVALLVFTISWSLVQLAKWKTRPAPIIALDDGALILNSDTARIQGPGQARVNDYAGKRNIGWWDHSSQWLEWSVDVPRSGSYRVALEYSLPVKMSTDLKLVAADQTLVFTAPASGGWDRWTTLDAGEIRLTVSVRSLTPSRQREWLSMRRGCSSLR